MINSKVHYSLGFPALPTDSAVVIYDQKLSKNPATKKWLDSFDRKMSVKAGESLKDIDQFPIYVRKLLKLAGSDSVRQLNIVAVGGGSVGDFAGFLASVLKRGVRLTHIPSTWLAAIDSAHGGKTALNVDSYKNQVGSFYAAHEIFISKALLKTQSSEQIISAYGELFKIALINGGGFCNKVLNLSRIDNNLIWQLLPDAVKSKMKVVRKDPYETTGHRYFLNLGHTFGHAFELDLGVSHGEAVLLGTEFSLRWSHNRKLLSDAHYKKINSKVLLRPNLKTKLTMKSLKRALSQDKKSAGEDKIHFVFLKKPGHCTVRKVRISEIIEEAKRQGWVS